MKKLAIILFLLSAACTHTKTVYDRVEVPKPYWDPPKREEIKELPPRAQLISDTITEEQARADTKTAFQALGEDRRALLEEIETIRDLYQKLVEFVTSEYKPKEEPHD